MSAAVNVSRNLQAIARELDEALERAAGERVAFSLIVWTPERVNYVGNGDREQVAAGMRELVAKREAGMADVPAHEIV